MVCRPTDCQVKYGGDTDAIFTFDNACRLCFEETSSNCNLCPAVSDGKYLGCFECHNGTNAQQLDLHENNDGVGVTSRDVVFLLAVCVIAIAICACICKCSTLCGIHWRSASCIRRSVAQADMHSNARPRANSDNVDAFSRGAFLAPSGKSYLDRHSFMRAAAQVERDLHLSENAHSFAVHPSDWIRERYSLIFCDAKFVCLRKMLQQAPCRWLAPTNRHGSLCDPHHMPCALFFCPALCAISRLSEPCTSILLDNESLADTSRGDDARC